MSSAQSTPSTTWRVVLVGIAGATGSGKSSLSRRLATRLNSPVIPFQQDWFFFAYDLPPGVTTYEEPGALDNEAVREGLLRVAEALKYRSCPRLLDPTLPPCAGVADPAELTGATQTTTGTVAEVQPTSTCGETTTNAAVSASPEAVETTGGSEVAASRSTRFAKFDRVCPLCRQMFAPKPKRHGMNLHRPSFDRYAADREGVVYVVAEGFLLFVDPELTRHFDVRILIDSPLPLCAQRRFFRENNVDVISAHAAATSNAAESRGCGIVVGAAADVADDAAAAQYNLNSDDWAIVRVPPEDRTLARLSDHPEFAAKYWPWFVKDVAPYFEKYWSVQQATAEREGGCKLCVTWRNDETVSPEAVADQASSLAARIRESFAL